MSERSKVAEFVSFCIEVFAHAKGMTGTAVLRLFDSCGLVRILTSAMTSFIRRDANGSWLTWKTISRSGESRHETLSWRVDSG